MGFFKRLATAALVLVSKQDTLVKIFEDALKLIAETKAVVNEVRK